MKNRIQQLQAELESLTAKGVKEVEDLRVKLLGKKGSITQLFDEFKTITAEEKRKSANI